MEPDEFSRTLAQSTLARAREQICPSCGAKDAVIIIYGRLPPGAAEDCDRLYGPGNWVGGGCFYDGEDFYCRSCRERFQGTGNWEPTTDVFPF